MVKAIDSGVDVTQGNGNVEMDICQKEVRNLSTKEFLAALHPLASKGPEIQHTVKAIVKLKTMLSIPDFLSSDTAVDRICRNVRILCDCCGAEEAGQDMHAFAVKNDPTNKYERCWYCKKPAHLKCSKSEQKC